MRWFGIYFTFIGMLCGLYGQSIHAQSIENATLQRFFDKEEQSMFEGVIHRMDNTQSVWVHIESAREFRKWTYQIAPEYLNVDAQEIQVWFQYASPQKSMSFGKRYNDWLSKKLIYDFHKAFKGRRVRIDYEVWDKANKMVGMLWVADQNINVWLVEQGYSFYLIERGLAPNHEDFLKAEKQAQSKKRGIWKASSR